MRHPLVQISPITIDGNIRSEVGLFTTWSGAFQAANPDKIRDLYIVPIANTQPAPVARNKAVASAQGRHVDILFQIDADMEVPPQFFEAAVDFLRKHKGPAVIGVPYCTAPPVEDCLVFEWASTQSATPTPHWKLEKIRREDAARRKGIEKVANIGTGCVAFTVDCFDHVPHPYFDYNYADETHTTVMETEDCWCFRRFGQAGIPIYVSWDHWSTHWKLKGVGKPQLIGQEHIDGLFIREAMENLRAVHLLPTDIPGNETTQDLAEVYRMAVEEAPDGGRFVEVGSWLGRSTILMAQIIKRSGKRIELYAVDTFQGSPSEERQQIAAGWEGGSVRAKFDQNLERYAVKDCVQVCPLPSTDAAILFDDDSLDFVYVDAEHTETAVTADIAAWRKKIKLGGTLAGHDWDWPGVRAAVEKSLPMAEVVIIGGRSWVWKKKG